MSSQSVQLLTPTNLTIPKQHSSLFLKPFSTHNRRFPVTTTSFPSLSIKAKAASSDREPSVLVSDNGTSSGVLSPASQDYASSSSIEVDAVTEAELRENGFRGTRRTKLICTIGPATDGFEQLEALAVGGMNVARLNMCHGTRDWHRTVIQRVRKLNEDKGYAVAIMMDTEGSEIHMGDLGGASSVKAEVRSLRTFIKHFLCMSSFLLSGY